MLAHCFDVLGMHRVFAPHFTDNPASGRVLRKLGMRPEGIWREHFFHQGAFKDAELYGILRPEFEAVRGPSDSWRDATSEPNARDVPA